MQRQNNYNCNGTNRETNTKWQEGSKTITQQSTDKNENADYNTTINNFNINTTINKCIIITTSTNGEAATNATTQQSNKYKLNTHKHNQQIRLHNNRQLSIITQKFKCRTTIEQQNKEIITSMP